MSPTGTAPSDRYFHSAVLSPAGDGFFVFGGCTASGGRFRDLHFYSVQAGEDGDFMKFHRNRRDRNGLLTKKLGNAPDGVDLFGTEVAIMRFIWAIKVAC